MNQPEAFAPVRLAYLQTLFAYDSWASRRIFTTAASLAPAALGATPLRGLGSLRQILVHLVSATWIWRSRLSGAPPLAMLDPAAFADLAAIEARWATEAAALHELLTSLDDQALVRPLPYQTTSGKALTTPIWQILVHLANHGTQHRSEAAAILTALDHSPGDLDLIVYFRAITPGNG